MAPAHEASLVVSLGVTGLSVLMLVAWPALLWVKAPAGERGPLVLRFSLGLLVYAGAMMGLAAAGVFAKTDARPSPVPLLLGSLVVGVVLVLRSRVGTYLAAAPLWLLVGMQGFRLPLELVMHQAAAEGTMPVQMTFGRGVNYDIVTGVTALVVAALIALRKAPRWLVLGWNVMGLALVITIAVVGVSSTPMFALFGREPERLNTWVLHAPFVWLPAVLVGSAVLGHLLIFRALKKVDPRNNPERNQERPR